MHALVGGAVEIVRGGNVDLPDIFGLPWGERFGVHRLDVGVGEQAEHLQAFLRFHLFGEHPNGFGLENIAAQRRGHLHVAADQEQHGLAVGRIEIQPRQAFFSDVHAGGHVVLIPGALAGVMQQNGEIQELWAFELIEQRGVALVPFRRRLIEAVKILDGGEGVLVDGEHVVGVELHLADDARPVGDQAPQQAGLV